MYLFPEEMLRIEFSLSLRIWTGIMKTLVVLQNLESMGVTGIIYAVIKVQALNP